MKYNFQKSNKKRIKDLEDNELIQITKYRFNDLKKIECIQWGFFVISSFHFIYIYPILNYYLGWLMGIISFIFFVNCFFKKD